MICINVEVGGKESQSFNDCNWIQLQTDNPLVKVIDVGQQCWNIYRRSYPRSTVRVVTCNAQLSDDRNLQMDVPSESFC